MRMFGFKLIIYLKWDGVQWEERGAKDVEGICGNELNEMNGLCMYVGDWRFMLV
jgi:hypothetical protein